MAQAKTQKLYRTFVRGMMSEASPLTYPEDTSADELNTVPTRKGNRTRRFGVNYSSDNISTQTFTSTDAQTSFMWLSAAANVANTFLVVQNGKMLRFYDRSAGGFADNEESFTIDLSAYLRPGVTSVGRMRCQFASGKGFLFVVGADIEPLIVQYNSSTNNITVQKITILIRDFEGLSDGLANDAEPTTLSKEHWYNLLNQGWISPGVS